jgi:hypothetical protein
LQRDRSSRICRESLIVLYSFVNPISRNLCIALPKINVDAYAVVFFSGNSCNMQSFSQASQDLFVLYMSQFKRNGTFLEIGSNHLSKHNNTYLLESQYDWKGIMVEMNTTFEIMYKIQRPKSLYYIGDSTKAPYFEMLTSNGFPKNIDYLQVDVDVNTGSTIETLIHLDSTVFDE